ncbi:MAG: hypothetical protein WAL90_17850 [Desulfobacterales bacterium]
MRYNWLPWKYILRRVAKTGGFIDPVALLAQFNKFAQPSEVAAPVELLRAGMLFHARGLINARTIQGNLDWVWPFWIKRQFDPLDKAFVPRSFALTHVNITHRNWTAVGLPDCNLYPIVDPRGLVTPFYDGWSLDAWVITEDGETLLPSGCGPPHQVQVMGKNRLTVETEFSTPNLVLRSEVDVIPSGAAPLCRIRYTATSNRPGALVVALRPFNPEGISFVYQVGTDPARRCWTVNDAFSMVFDPPMDRHVASEYRQGDVYAGVLQRKEKMQQNCSIGMATAAAIFHLKPDEPVNVSLKVALDEGPETVKFPSRHNLEVTWQAALRGASRLQIRDEKIKTLYDAALHTLVLLSPLEIYPGPFYYKRFWFRDAVFILNALLSAGLHDRAEKAINQFLPRQTLTGYFESQKGEWDSNGQALWIFNRFNELTGKDIPGSWLKAADRAAGWILRKRLPANSEKFQAGLLPAGFSAEHLGNNDFYYWDDFWGIAGLKAAAVLFKRSGEKHRAEKFDRGAEHFALCTERSLLRSRILRERDAVPASPYRRMDAGAVGSIIAGYPLQLWPPREPRLLETLEFLLEHCFIDHAFFQDMIHSGFNIYLTLHCAQVLLRAGDPRYLPLLEKVADLASPTGHWPEAVHPQTLGGCMGDGQHAWAAAEWIMIIHNMFAAEEGADLILLRGVPQKWLSDKAPLEIGPIHTRFGAIDITLESDAESVTLSWAARWRRPPAKIEVCLPGTAPVNVKAPESPHGTLRLVRHSRP